MFVCCAASLRPMVCSRIIGTVATAFRHRSNLHATTQKYPHRFDATKSAYVGRWRHRAAARGRIRDVHV